ncbi:MAG: AAA family ATPase [Deltaproteobacteria bacterium]|nr:AAA family ATPase [Deltaproteobacteria bacterium]
MTETRIQKFYQAISQRLYNKFFYGDEMLLKLIAIAYLARGHVLIEGPPGTGKTLISKLFAHSLALEFKRIQFAPVRYPGLQYLSHGAAGI